MAAIQRSFVALLLAAVLLSISKPVAAGGAANSSFYVVFRIGNLNSTTTKSGSFIARVHPLWAPKSAARFWTLVHNGFFDGLRFYRVVRHFIVQFGLYGEPSVMSKWATSAFKEDRVAPVIRWRTNMRGRIGFTQPLLPGLSADDSPGATTELYMNLGHNVYMDDRGFLPVAEVLCGFEAIDSIFAVGDYPPMGDGPSREMLRQGGNTYMQQQFPSLSLIHEARIMHTIVQCRLTTGDMTIRVRPDWGPLGAQRFLSLVRSRYFDGCAFFRAIKGFIVQFGISPNDKLREKWRKEVPPLRDDPQRADVRIQAGVLAYAGLGANSRRTQMWIALDQMFPVSKTMLGRHTFDTPFAELMGEESFRALRKISTKYGDTVPQRMLWTKDGYHKLKENFPELDYIQTCRVVPQGPPPGLEADPTAPRL
mmetsp:Transcript_36615/g.67107  ORF Transcript_36615/g.67107 Transcript_36615/m.67107 type:complete len:423 (+) Transcript_36615:96-1364(+)